jgi:hypothetical protein
MDHGFEVDLDVDPDSGFESEVMILPNSKDEPMVERRTGHGKDKCRNNRPPTTAHDVVSIHRSSYSERREDHRPGRLDTPKRTVSEDELSQQVTHVCQAVSFPAPRFVCSQ